MLNVTIIVGNLEGWWNGLVFGVRAKFPNLDFLYCQSDSQSVLGHTNVLKPCEGSPFNCASTNLLFKVAKVSIQKFISSNWVWIQKWKLCGCMLKSFSNLR